jgi:hypothetical protein
MTKLVMADTSSISYPANKYAQEGGECTEEVVPILAVADEDVAKRKETRRKRRAAERDLGKARDVKSCGRYPASEEKCQSG